MNKIYRLVWNASQRAWVVAGEFATAKGKGKGGTTRRALVRAGGLSGAFAAALFSIEPAEAWMVNPTSVVNPGAGTSDGGRQSNIAIGWDAKATGADYSIAIGTSSVATNVGSIALGTGAQSAGDRSLAVGHNSQATGASSSALGVSSLASGEQSVAFGNVSKASGGLSSAIGAYTSAAGLYSSAIGFNANASGGQTLAMGTSSIATADYSSALGAYAEATAGGASAIGIGAKAHGYATSAIGYGALATNRDGVAIGHDAVTKNSDDIDPYPTGRTAATAIGSGAKALQDYAVALGAQSITSDPISTSTVVFNGATKSVAGATAAGTVSIGGGGDNKDKVRTITNVAAGRVSATSTDAINGSELFALGDTPLTFTGNTGTVDKKLGNTLNIQGTSATAGTYSGNNLKTVVDTSGVMQLQMADNPVVNSVIATDGTNTTTLAASGLTVTGGPSVTTTGIDAGGKKVVNVADGDVSATSTDAINGSQLKTTNDQVANNTTNIANNTTNIIGLQDDALQWDATLNAYSANHMGEGSSKITNVAAGDVSATSTDAINGSQLYATNEQVTTNTTNIAGNTTAITNLGDTVDNIYNTGTKYFHANSTGTDSVASGVDAIAIGMGSVADVARSVALGDGAKTAAAVGTSSATIGGQSYAFAGTAPVGTVSVGDVGEERTITNVAAGRLSETSTDAVNGSQLNATNEQVTTNTTNIATNMADITNLGDTVDNIYNTGTKYFHANSTGTDSSATGVDAIAIGMGSVADVARSVALGDGAKTAAAVGTSSATIGGQSYAFAGTAPVGTVSVGDVGEERTITNVAAGRLSETSTDAVNGSQLNATNEQVTTNTTNIATNMADITNLGDTVDNIYNTGTKYFHANSTGTDSSATGVDAIAIGMGSVADVARSVALGDGAKTAAAVGTSSATIGGQSYAFAGTAPVGTVSVGDVGEERTITNVAAGRLSETSTDAVNGSQLNATNEQVTTNTTNIATNMADITNLGDTVDNIYNTGTKYFHANSTGTDSSATGVDAIAIGMGSVADVARSVALGDGAKTAAAVGTSSATIGGQNYAFAGTAPVGTLSVGDVGAERTITNVAAGRLSDTSTDAVNGSQLFASNQAIDSITNNFNGLDGRAVKYDLNADGTVNHDRITLEGAPTQITNVAAGELSATSTDAVNGSQLNATNEQVTTNTTNIANNAADITNLGDDVNNIYNTGTKYFHANSTGTDSSATGVDAVAIGMGAIASADGSIALGAGSVADGSTLANQAYLVGGTAAGEVNVGDRRITGLAAGADDMDGVNVAQLKAVTANSVADAVMYDNSAHNSITLGGDSYDNSTHTGGTTITNVADGVAPSDAVNYSQLTETNTNVTNLGDEVDNIYNTGTKYFHANSTGTDSSATGVDAIAIGMGSVADVARSVALGDGAKTAAAVGTGSATIGGQSYAFAGTAPVGTLSVGDVGAERTITNVAAGRLSDTSTDAVNGSQLFASNQAIDSITNNFNGLDGRAVKYDLNADGTVNHDRITLEGAPTQITNVAAGELSATSTDAVNGSQLNTTNEQVTTNTTNIAGNTSNIANNTADIAGNTTNIANNTVNIDALQDDALQWDPTLNAYSADHMGNGPAKITNVAAGELSATSTDAVNGSQLNATNEQVTTNTTNIANNAADITNLGDDVNNIYNTGTKYFHANSTGTDSVASGVDAVAIGMGAIASADGSIALGAGSVADGSTLANQAYLVGGTATGEVNVGDRRITGLAAGADDMDGVNVAQLKAVTANSVADAVMYDNSSHDHITLGGDSYDNSTHTGGTTITNVADGVAPSDAVNFSQLTETNNQVTTNTTNIAGNTTDIANNTADIATNTTNIANNTVNIDGLKDDALQWDATANGGDGAYSADHMGNGPAKITNVAAGELSATSTDAVNGSQLNATNEQVTTNTTNIANNAADITNLGDNVNNIYNTGTKYFHANSTGTDSSATGVDAVAIGMGAIASADGSIALGAGSVADGSTLANQAYLVGGTATGEVNVGDRRITGLAAGADDMDGVNVAQLKAVTADSVADAVMYDNSAHNSITLGGDAYDNSTHTGGTTITNVADGVAPSDAVNFSQLTETNNQVTTNTTNIANNAADITNLGDDVNNIYNTGTKYFHANSTGTDSSATGVDAIAIGMGSVADVARSVALGDGAKTLAAVGTSGTTIQGTDYAFAGVAPVGTVSVGDVGAERTITNVAAGRLSGTSTDAVNGSQLFASNQAIDSINNNFNGLDGRAVKYDLNADGTVNHDRITLEGAPTQITNVKAGELSATSSDAVNGSQLNATNEQVSINTSNIATNTTNINGLKDDALQWDATANGGNGAYSANHMGNGPAKITNVAAGDLTSTSTDAVNGSQLKETNDQVTNNTVNIDGLKQDALLWDSNLGAFSASHGSVTVNKITNVAAGELSEASKDAVNGSQLFATNTNVTNLDNRVTNIEDTINNLEPTQVKYLKVNSKAAGSVATGSEAIAIGPNAVASGDDSIASGNGAISSGIGSIAMGSNADASGDGSVATGSNAKASGKDSTAMGNGAVSTAANSVALGANSLADRADSVSVGSAGHERQITNLAAGTEDTDAVNVAQLKEISGDVTNVNNAITKISNGTDGMFQVNNTNNLSKPTVEGKNALAGGAGASASGSNSMAVGMQSKSSGTDSVALGNSSSATARNSVALGTNSVADRDNTVSVGSVGGERQIANVAAGTKGTDAVNVSQLNEGINNSYQYTDNKFDSLKNMVEDNKNKMSAGVAGAMAMASLPQPYAPGASMVSMGGGTFQSQSAVALGVSAISDNGKWVTKVAGTTNSQGDFGASLGVGYQW